MDITAILGFLKGGTASVIPELLNLLKSSGIEPRALKGEKEKELAFMLLAQCALVEGAETVELVGKPALIKGKTVRVIAVIT